MRKMAEWTSLMALVFLVVGCGRSDVVVTGKLTFKGETYKPAQDEQVMVMFAEDAGGKVGPNAFPTRVGPDGTFRITGPDNGGIKPGKYRVGVTSVPEKPTPGKPMADKFKGEYDVKKTPILVDVTPSKSDFSIELK